MVIETTGKRQSSRENEMTRTLENKDSQGKSKRKLVSKEVEKN